MTMEYRDAVNAKIKVGSLVAYPVKRGNKTALAFGIVTELSQCTSQRYDTAGEIAPSLNVIACDGQDKPLRRTRIAGLDRTVRLVTMPEPLLSRLCEAMEA